MDWFLVLKRKALTGIVTAILSTLVVFVYFKEQVDTSILWLIFLVFAVAIFSYGIAVSLLADFLSKKTNPKPVALFIRFLVYLFFGSILFLGEFLVFYSLTASLLFFIFDEAIRYGQLHSLDATQ
ncbi:hypothetical protein A8F94_22195 [Bacillus sp. FJAT-27225]|uniref:hypothetical protein n=1 Tax=Bacillus sp. FJAT-27225 TaxID=1743144 RepID=UPI00080C32BA|nr:hypothetical protein [Bacillus sp. FJAT-27225]OCA81583.1 hypothetical protein A8F94_22195 [Bacillus sp. FJAT-27225]